jgi:hypothetical protein
VSGLLWQHEIVCTQEGTFLNVWISNPDPYTVSWVEYWGDLTGQPSTANLAPGAITPKFSFKITGTEQFTFGANAQYPEPVGRRDPGVYVVTATELECADSTTTTEQATTTTTGPEDSSTSIVITVAPTTTTIVSPATSISATVPTVPGRTIPILPRTGAEDAAPALIWGSVVIVIGVFARWWSRRGNRNI